MARARDCAPKIERGGAAIGSRHNTTQTRKANHLKDEVYREMFLLESHRPGAEMGLALALLRAYVEAELLTSPDETREWLKTITPVGLQMIELALRDNSSCGLE